MTAPVDLCNLALSRLGDSANISSIDPPDDSVQAHHCAAFYPIALKQALDQHNWRFATRRVDLAERENDADDEWLHCYAMPSDFVNLIRVSSPGVDSIDMDYDIAIAPDSNQVLYADIKPLTLVYVSSSVSYNLFSPAFINYLTALLAHHLAGPILKGDVGASAAQKFLQLSQSLLVKAVERDSQNTRKFLRYVPEGIKARE